MFDLVFQEYFEFPKCWYITAFQYLEGCSKENGDALEEVMWSKQGAMGKNCTGKGCNSMHERIFL